MASFGRTNSGSLSGASESNGTTFPAAQTRPESDETGRLYIGAVPEFVKFTGNAHQSILWHIDPATTITKRDVGLLREACVLLRETGLGATKRPEFKELKGRSFAFLGRENIYRILGQTFEFRHWKEDLKQEEKLSLLLSAVEKYICTKPQEQPERDSKTIPKTELEVLAAIMRSMHDGYLLRYRRNWD